MLQLSYDIPLRLFFTVYDGAPAGYTAFEIRDMETLSDYAKFLGVPTKNALEHAYKQGWLDFQTMTEWYNLVGEDDKKTQVQTSNVLSANVTQWALIIVLGILAYNSLTKE